MFSAKKKKKRVLLFDKKIHVLLLLLLFCFGKKKAFNKTSGRKTKVSPLVLPETSGHESKRRAKNHASRRRRRGEGGALTRRAKNVPIVGIVVTISPSLSLYKMVVLPAASRPTCVRFSASMREESLRSVPTHTTSREKKFRATDARIHSTRSKSHHDATPRRDEAADVPSHRISQNSKTNPPAFFSSGRCPLRPPLLQARNSKSNPLPLHHQIIIIVVENAVRFDDE